LDADTNIWQKVRSMLSNFGLENHFWAEVMWTSCYLINQSPTIALDDGILEEVQTSKKVNYVNMIFFGCEAFLFPKSIELS